MSFDRIDHRFLLLGHHLTIAIIAGSITGTVLAIRRIARGIIPICIGVSIGLE